MILEINGFQDHYLMLNQLDLAETVEMLISKELTQWQKVARTTAIRRSSFIDSLALAVEVLEEVDVLCRLCPICQKDMDGSSSVVQLRCQHSFHKSCIKIHLLSRHSRKRCRLCDQAVAA